MPASGLTVSRITWNHFFWSPRLKSDAGIPFPFRHGDVSAAGVIAGYYLDEASVFHGFVRAAGPITTFDAPGAGTYNGQEPSPIASTRRALGPRLPVARDIFLNVIAKRLAECRAGRPGVPDRPALQFHHR